MTVEIMCARAKNFDLIEKERIAEQERIAKMLKREKDIKECTEKLLLLCKEKIENASWSTFEILVWEKDISKYTDYWNNELIDCCCKKVIDILTDLCYEVSWYEYSKGWKTRSGKFGYFTVKVPSLASLDCM